MFKLALLVLCTIQIATALPRPDFGINVQVFGSQHTAITARDTRTLVGKVNQNLDIVLTSGYPLLDTIKTQLLGIANNFSNKGFFVTQALDLLATSTGQLNSAFGSFEVAAGNLITLVNTGLDAYYTVLDTNLDDSISTMVKDALVDVTAELTKLGGLLSTLKTQVQAAVTAAGSNAPSKAILRKYVSTTLTSDVAKSAISLKALIPLVTYILANSIDNIKLADDYIVEAGTVAEDALLKVSQGQEALEAEIQLYTDGTNEVAVLVGPTAQANLDLSGLDTSGIPLIESEINEYKETYTTVLTNTIAAIQATYITYKTSVPFVSDGLTAFYSESACDHLYRLVKVVISNGVYADYCYNKYSPRTFGLFYEQAREANRCVDQEITRLIKLEQVVLTIAKLLVFSVEDVLAQVTICVKTPAQCNVAPLELAFHKVHQAMVGHQTTMQNIVAAETVAGLNRLKACFTTSKYLLVIATNAMVGEINKCEIYGPNAA
ncbi:uncharacterized protein LOC126560345 [Anopheles maculipalpis]|uniref:uncharacterized protein LOC126560345 n=1 Tax=Anopheles maculipalpis TaxID=1496333 RepID=UPI002158F5D6|nr:uncharacterized protein LOC126560345 [Anopheles maculipalpis]